MSTTAPRLPIHALISELDGLFVDCESLAGEAIAAIFRWPGREGVDAEVAQQLTGRRLRDMLAIVTGVCGQGLSNDALAREFEELGLTLLQDLLQPAPGATGPVALAPEPGLPLAPATSGVRRDSAAVLAATRRAGAFSLELTHAEAARAAMSFPASSLSCRGG